MATATTCDLCGKICIFKDGALTDLHIGGKHPFKIDLCAEHGNELIKWIESRRTIKRAQ